MTISDLSRTFIDGTQKESEGKRSHTKNVRYVYLCLVDPAFLLDCPFKFSPPPTLSYFDEMEGETC